MKGADDMDIEIRNMFERLFDSMEKFELNVKEEINGIKEEIKEIKEDMKEMKEEIKEMKEEIKEIKEEIKEIKEEQVRMNNKIDILGQMYGAHEIAIQTLRAKKII
jgi:uncharacterized coiled-coil DUF342 family protein